MKYHFWLAALSIFLTLPISCKNETSQPNTPETIAADGVILISQSIKFGNPNENDVNKGLQSAADILSSLYTEALNEYPGLTGNIRGTFHIESDGTVRMFAQKDSIFSPEEGKSIASDFIGATFGKKYQFPNLGEDVLLEVDYQIEPKGNKSE